MLGIPGALLVISDWLGGGGGGGAFFGGITVVVQVVALFFFVPLGHHNAQFMNGNPKGACPAGGWLARLKVDC